jgi:hypothetical protein
MKTDDIEAMKRAIAAYAGPVTRCSPGKARAKPLRRKKVLDDATRWLQRHRHDVSVLKRFVDENVEVERGRLRKARAERKRKRRAANAVAGTGLDSNGRREKRSDYPLGCCVLK